MTGAKYIVSMIMLVNVFNVQAQDIPLPATHKTDTTLAKYKCYYSIESALSAPVDSVYNICLVSAGLKKFPVEVLRFTKLRALLFSSDSKLKHFNELTQKEKKQILKEQKESGPQFLSDDYKPNTFKKVPEQIKELKHLRYLDLLSSKVSSRHGEEIQSWLPGCEVIYDGLLDKLDR